MGTVWALNGHDLFWGSLLSLFFDHNPRIMMLSLEIGSIAGAIIGNALGEALLLFGSTGSRSNDIPIGIRPIGRIIGDAVKPCRVIGIPHANGRNAARAVAFVRSLRDQIPVPPENSYRLKLLSLRKPPNVAGFDNRRHTRLGEFDILESALGYEQAALFEKFHLRNHLPGDTH